MRGSGNTWLLRAFFCNILSIPIIAFSQTPPTSQNTNESRSAYQKWLTATINSLNCMREKDGLIADAIAFDPNQNGPCPIRVINNTTSPTNIGFDLLILLQENSPLLEPTLAAVEKLEVDPASGLYYNWYNIKAPFEVRYPYLSSVDNFHLALAFWVLAQEHSNPAIRARAQVLFDRMNFSAFLYEDSQLVRGGLSESWAYKHYGTEARALYSLGWTIGLYKTKKPDGKITARVQTTEEHQRMLNSLIFEVANLPIEDRTLDSLATWDGGAFQLLLPELLLGESSRSFRYKNLFDNYARFVESETKRRELSVPAAHSASQFCIGECEGLPRYNGKAGSLSLVSRHNKDPQKPNLSSMWEASFTPHAAILGLLTSERLFPLMQRAETIGGLYDPRIGWADGYWTTGARKNEVVPVQLALDQQMIAMSLSRLGSEDNQSVSQRALNRNPVVKAALNSFYDATETRLSPSSLVASP